MKPNDANELKHSDNVDEFPVVILPGCKKPLKPPEKVLPPGHSIHPDPKEAMKWMTNNVLSHYWILEKDGSPIPNHHSKTLHPKVVKGHVRGRGEIEKKKKTKRKTEKETGH